MFSKDCVIAITLFLCKAFLWNLAILHGLLHHSLFKDQLIPPVEAHLQQTNHPKFVHKYVAEDLFQEDSKTVRPIPHCAKVTPSLAQIDSFAACNKDRSGQ